MRCWHCRNTDTMAAHSASVVSLIAALETGLTDTAVEQAIARAAPTGRQRRWLVEHLAATPDALTSAALDGPRVLGRLMLELRDAGATGVLLPVCPGCQRPAAQLRGNAASGKLCRACWSADPERRRTCVFCGRLRVVNARTAAGEPACNTCYAKHLQPERRCDGCGQMRRIFSNERGKALCAQCYRHPRRACGQCGRLKRIKLRATAEHPDLCGSCHWGTVATCTRCSEIAEGYGVSRGEQVCLRCAAVAQLDALLTRPDGTILDSLAGLREAFRAAEQPRSVLRWTARSPGATLLRKLATGELPLTHEALDALRPTPSSRHLHALLVATGALPERDPYLANLIRAVDQLIAAIDDPDDARTIRGYARWHVVARLRRRAGQAGVTVHQAHRARDMITEPARFLRWLRERNSDLSHCTQADIDAWLADRRPHLRPFLQWAAERGDAPPLHVPASPAWGGTRSADHEQRWALARRLLHGGDLDPADRVVGALVVLYAQPLTRIARLRLEDLHDVDGEIHVSFGGDRVHMPGPLGDLLRELPWRRQVGPSGTAPSYRWLFPGRQAGRHLHPTYLAARLNAVGIQTRAMRTTALLQLGAQLPPAVLAGLLNVHPTTAVRYTKTSGGDWADYAAARTAAGKTDTPSPRSR